MQWVGLTTLGVFFEIGSETVDFLIFRSFNFNCWESGDYFISFFHLRGHDKIRTFENFVAQLLLLAPIALVCDVIPMSELVLPREFNDVTWCSKEECLEQTLHFLLFDVDRVSVFAIDFQV